MKVNPTNGTFEITESDYNFIFNLFGDFWARFRVPKNKKDKIGIILAIKTENNKEKLRLENDLLLPLERYLTNSNLSENFYLIRYPQFLAEKLTNLEVAKKYLKKSKGHLALFGELIERNLERDNNYIFRLHGMVRHAPITYTKKAELAKDFSEILPRQIIFPETKEILGFDATQSLLGSVVKYIIAYAARASFDVELAYELFDGLYGELEAVSKTDFPVELQIRGKCKNQLIDCLTIKVSRLYEDYAAERKAEHIFAAKPFVEKILQLDPEHYQGRLMKAILLFKEDSIDEAINELIHIHNSDSAWRYSLGFLYAYKGDILDALEQYKEANAGISTPNVLNDTEVFISEEIDKKPQLVQLLFFRGLLNYKGKGDYVLAKIDFESFLASNKANKDTKLVELAKKFLNQIDRL